MSNNPRPDQQQRISPAQRAINFAQSTRQHWKMLPAIAGAENARISFELPKVRLLGRIRLLVQATLNVQHAANVTYVPALFAPYRFLRRVQVEANNGFTPFNVSGMGLYFYNLLQPNSPAMRVDNVAGRSKVQMPLVAAPAPGANNAIRFVVDLPVALNDRDPIGFVMLQNGSVVVNVNVDLGAVADLAPAAAGYTFAVNNISITPMVETYSIPARPDALPDLSILKLVHEKIETIAGAQVATIKLPVGTTYRRIIVWNENAAGAGVADNLLAGDMEILFNQADIPYSISPTILSAINAEQYAAPLPVGLHVFDFAYQGIPGYGGARDYVDTERLTEFWLRFNAPAAGTCRVVYETLSRLRA